MGEEVKKSESGYVTTIFFNRPEKRNALNADALFTVGDVVRDVEQKKSARVIVLRGEGDKAFCAGVDLSGGSSDFKRTIEGLDYCLTGLIECSCPIISMIFGSAIGAGLDIVVISDFRIAEEQAKFGAPLVRLGRTYYYTAIGRLTRLIGLSAAKEILLTGKLINSQRAFQMGLINTLASHDELESTVQEFACDLAEGTSPLAVRVTKQTIRKIFEETPIDPVVEKELKRLADSANQSGDAKEGVQAMLEKRKPSFTGE